MLSGPENLPSVNDGKLSPGILGNIQTLKEMKKIANFRKGHPLVRKLALNILAYYNVPSQFFLSEAQAIGQYVQEKVRYVRDALGIEQVHDPVTMIDQIINGTAQGDCDDMALLLAALLLSVGHKPRFRTVRYRDLLGPYNHIYVVVYEKNRDGPRKRLVLDPIVKDKVIGFEVPHKSGREWDI